MSEREASLPEYIIMLGNSDHRAAQEYCDLIRKCEKQAAEIERLSEKEVATWQTNQAQARENTQQAKRIKELEKAAGSLKNHRSSTCAGDTACGNHIIFRTSAARDAYADLIALLPQKEESDG